MEGGRLLVSSLSDVYTVCTVLMYVCHGRRQQRPNFAVNYVLYGCYGKELTKDKKRAVRKKAAKLVVDRGEVYLMKKERKVRVVYHKYTRIIQTILQHAYITNH